MFRAQAPGCALLSLSLPNGCPSQTTPDPPAALPGPSLARADWQYIRVDDRRGKWGDFGPPEWLRYFGVAVGDLTGDGYPDIVSGRYFYRSSGGDLSGDWVRRDLGRNLGPDRGRRYRWR